jgi:uncharacterized phage protein (predicted DNA packaging)
MLVSLADVKQYLRVTLDDDDALLEQLLTSAQELCMAVARTDGSEELSAGANQMRIGILYAVAYLYEHREEADHHAMDLTLRALLFGSRKEGF